MLELSLPRPGVLVSGMMLSLKSKYHLLTERYSWTFSLFLKIGGIGSQIDLGWNQAKNT